MYLQVLSSVSIHAPREGCDYRFNPFRLLAYQFQFTHPGRGATIKAQSISDLSTRFNSRTPGGVRLNRERISTMRLRFQFTHPGRGATDEESGITAIINVSIHAPREGCDSSPIVITLALVCFNSRTPGGVRRLEILPCHRHWAFQFTHPGRGATLDRLCIRQASSVSIHAPREGCDY